MRYRDHKGRLRDDNRLRWNDPLLTVRIAGRNLTPDHVREESAKTLALFDEHVEFWKITGVDMGMASSHYSNDATYNHVCPKGKKEKTP